MLKLQRFSTCTFGQPEASDESAETFESGVLSPSRDSELASNLDRPEVDHKMVPGTFKPTQSNGEYANDSCKIILSMRIVPESMITALRSRSELSRKCCSHPEIISTGAEKG